MTIHDHICRSWGGTTGCSAAHGGRPKSMSETTSKVSKHPDTKSIKIIKVVRNSTPIVLLGLSLFLSMLQSACIRLMLSLGSKLRCLSDCLAQDQTVATRLPWSASLHPSHPSLGRRSHGTGSTRPCPCRSASRRSGMPQHLKQSDQQQGATGSTKKWIKMV